MMKLKDFKLGTVFWMSGKQYKTTDVGTRCVVAIRIRECYAPKNYRERLRGRKDASTFLPAESVEKWYQDQQGKIKSKWFKIIGHSYAVAELVIDPDDMGACYKRAPDWYLETYCRRFSS